MRGFADIGLGHDRIVCYLIDMKVFLRGDMRMTSCLVDTFVLVSTISFEFSRDVLVQIDRESSELQCMGKG